MGNGSNPQHPQQDIIKYQKILSNRLDKKTKIFSLNLLTYCLQYDIIYTGGEEKMPKRKKKKATAIEIADIVIKAVVAVAALITAISQWK